jgi:hypothetical protein
MTQPEPLIAHRVDPDLPSPEVDEREPWRFSWFRTLWHLFWFGGAFAVLTAYPLSNVLARGALSDWLLLAASVGGYFGAIVVVALSCADAETPSADAGARGAR